MELLYISFGWLLGLLSPLIIDAARRRRETPILYRTLLRELDDLRYRLVMSVIGIQDSRGCLSREILTWAIPILNRYQGIYRNEKRISNLKRLASAPEEELNQASGQQGPEGRHKRLRALEAPFLESLVPELNRLEPDIQQNLLDIRAQLGFFNELSEDQREMLRISWGSSFSSGDRMRVGVNLKMTYDDAVNRAKLIVERINGLDERRI